VWTRPCDWPRRILRRLSLCSVPLTTPAVSPRRSPRCSRLPALGRTHAGLVATLAHTSTAATIPPIPAAAQGPEDRGAQLSERELQVLLGMSWGKNNSQIGRELFLAQDEDEGGHTRTLGGMPTSRGGWTSTSTGCGSARSSTAACSAPLC
jgi:hypothetical protein